MLGKRVLWGTLNLSKTSANDNKKLMKLPKVKSIGIDIREAGGQGAGKGRYAEEITRAIIAAAPKSTKFILFTKAEALGEGLPRRAVAKRMLLCNPRLRRQRRIKQVVLPGQGIFWHLRLRRYLKKHPVGFFIAPTSYIYPAIAPCHQRLATVVHDLIAFLHPKENHWFATLVERLTLGRAIRRSEFVICVSKNTARDLVKVKPRVSAKPVVIAPPAVSRAYKPTKAKTVTLPKKFILAVGTLQPRKNLQLLFEALPDIARAHPNLYLCIAGGEGWKMKEVFKDFPEWMQDRVHLLGYVSNPQIVELYSRASALIFPSLYEGFGIPPLEAMACGCPVIASNTSAIPEVVGRAAILIDPEDPISLTRAVLEVLKPATAKKHKKRGLARAKKFTWRSSAKAILGQIFA